MQPGFRGQEGAEQVLGHQLRVLIRDGPLLGCHQGVVGLLGKGEEGHGTPHLQNVPDLIAKH